MALTPPHTHTPFSGWDHVPQCLPLCPILLPPCEGKCALECACPSQAPLHSSAVPPLCSLVRPVQAGQEAEVDSWLRRKHEGFILDTELVQREDLDLVRARAPWVGVRAGHARGRHAA